MLTIEQKKKMVSDLLRILRENNFYQNRSVFYQRSTGYFHLAKTEGDVRTIISRGSFEWIYGLLEGMCQMIVQVQKVELIFYYIQMAEKHEAEGETIGDGIVSIYHFVSAFQMRNNAMEISLSTDGVYINKQYNNIFGE